MSQLSNALRAAANLADAVPQGLEIPAIYVEVDNRVTLQFDCNRAEAVEGWAALLLDAHPGRLDSEGYRQIEGVFQDVVFEAWAPLS
jgi:hypothetical protein